MYTHTRAITLPSKLAHSRPSKNPAGHEKWYKAHTLGSINVNKKGRRKIQTGEMCSVNLLRCYHNALLNIAYTHKHNKSSVTPVYVANNTCKTFICP